MPTLFPVLLLAFGLVVLGANVVVESEPGALPLLLVLGSSAWLFVARRRARIQNL